MAEIELKACPFCGGNAEHNGGGNSVYGRFWWAVGCTSCDISMHDQEVWDKAGSSKLDKDYPPQECFSRWNTRPIEDAKDTRIAELEAENKRFAGELVERDESIAELAKEVERLHNRVAEDFDYKLGMEDRLSEIIRFVFHIRRMHLVIESAVETKFGNNSKVYQEILLISETVNRLYQGYIDNPQTDDFSNSFTVIWYEHQRWSYGTFGGPEVKGPIGPIKHLGKEQKELLENPNDASEYADCMFLIMDAARRQGLGLQGLLKAMADKQKILWTRDYKADPNKPDEPVEHNRAAGGQGNG